MQKEKAKSSKTVKSSGNVFADIGVPNADEHFIKSEIVMAIAGLVKNRGLTQLQTANLIGLAQPDVSKLLRGNFAGYSLERLLGFLRALGRDVEIRVTAAKTKRMGTIHIEVA